VAALLRQLNSGTFLAVALCGTPNIKVNLSLQMLLEEPKGKIGNSDFLLIALHVGVNQIPSLSKLNKSQIIYESM
jgi:hypothetical protein